MFSWKSHNPTRIRLGRCWRAASPPRRKILQKPGFDEFFEDFYPVFVGLYFLSYWIDFGFQHRFSHVLRELCRLSGGFAMVLCRFHRIKQTTRPQAKISLREWKSWNIMIFQFLDDFRRILVKFSKNQKIVWISWFSKKKRKSFARILFFSS